MALNPHKTFKQNIAVKGQKLEYVLNFNYLGITLDTNLSWKQQLKRSKLIQLQNSLPIIKMHGGSISKAASPALEVFKYKVVILSLWGPHCKRSFELGENTFIRRVLGLPVRTPLVSVLMDLNIKRMDQHAILRPLLFWVQLWATPELTTYKEGLLEILDLDKSRTILWLKHVSTW